MAAPKGTIPPNAGEGRVPGTPNRVTRDVRAALAEFAEGNVDKLQGWLDRVAAKDPAKAAELFVRVLEYHVPKPLRAQLLERRDIAVPGVIHDNVETSKCGNRRLHGRLSGAFICHVKRDRANAVAVFFYQVIKSLRVACCGDESIAGFEYSLRNVSAQTARAAGD